MPSLFRFLALIGIVVAVATVGLYVLATKFEPVPREEVKVVPGVKIRTE